MMTRLLHRRSRFSLRGLVLSTSAVCLGALAACGPKTPEVTNYADYACQQAQVAQASAQTNMEQYDTLVAEIAQRQAAKVELERLRSRIRTNRITDLELAEWRQEQERARLAAIADTARTDSVTTETPEQAPGDEAAATDSLTFGEATPTDTATTVQPEGSEFDEGAADTSAASESFEPQEEPSSEGATPLEDPGTSSVDEGADTETIDSGTEGTASEGEASPSDEEMTSPSDETTPQPDETTPQPDAPAPEQSGETSTESQPELGADEEGWTTTTEEDAGESP